MNDMWVCVAFGDGCQWQLVGGYDPTIVPEPSRSRQVIRPTHNTKVSRRLWQRGVPGGRFGAATWTDASGNFWLFGGSTTASHYYNDLWKYDTELTLPGINYTSTEGTWTPSAAPRAVDQPGVYTAGTLVPGSRTNAATWTDGSGNFWLFGGSGYDGTGPYRLPQRSVGIQRHRLDLGLGRQHQPEGQNGNYGAQGVAASTNIPGGRHEAADWTDANGNLWLFGGEGNDSVGTAFGILNDLWMYNIASNQWTWVAGSNVANQNGGYPSQTVVGSVATTTAAGTCGLSVGVAPDCPAVPLTNAAPGSRWGASGWIDAGGNLWLFGGWGLDSKRTDGNGSLNDLWVYTPNATPGQLGTWAWVKGSNTGAQNGVYGTSNTYPWDTLLHLHSGRPQQRHRLGRMDSGQFWLFGGEGYDSTSTTGNGFLNDMWRYVPYQ